FTDPGTEVLGGRVLQALDLVQVVVVELEPQRLDRVPDVAEVEQPAGLGIDLPFHLDLDAERVPMEPATLVPRRRLGQEVRRLERKIARQPDPHQWRPESLWV